jgi:hypothetical protein
VAFAVPRHIHKRLVHLENKICADLMVDAVRLIVNILGSQLSGGLGLVELPRLDLACEQLVQLGSSPLGCLRKNEPSTDRGKGTDTARKFRASTKVGRL